MKKKSAAQAYKGMSFAKAAKKISDKYKNRDTNAIEERSFMAEMNALMQHQEMLKLKESAGKAIKGSTQPVEASSYAKKALGGGLDPNAMFGIGQAVGDFLQYNNAATDFDAVNPWEGTQRAMNPFQPVAPIPSKTFTAQSPPPLLTENQKTGYKDAAMQTAAKAVGAISPVAGAMFGKTSKPGSGEVEDVTGFKDWFNKNMYSPLVMGKGVEAVGKLAMLASGYDKAVPQYNPYESDIRRQMQTRGMDLTQSKQDILSAENAAQQNLNNVRSANVRTALQQNVTGQSADALSRASMTQQQFMNQVKGEYAQTLNNLGQQRVQAENYAEQLTAQSKGMYQMGLQNMLESVGQTGQKVTDYRANIAQQKLINSVLQTKDFKVADPTGAIQKAIQGDEIGMQDIVTLEAGIKDGTITPDNLQAELEKLKEQHRQRTAALKG